MSSTELLILLLSYSLSTALLATLAFFTTQSRKFAVVIVLLSFAGVAIAVAVGALLDSGSNFVVQTWLDLTRLKRPTVTAFALGAGFSVPWLLLAFSSTRRRWVVALNLAGYTGSLLLAGVIAGKELISPYLPHPDSTVAAGQINTDVDPAFKLELLGQLGIIPIRIAVDPDSGRVYVSGNQGIAAQQGAVVELEFHTDGRLKGERTIAPGLNRPHGLAVYRGDIYVSRSGQYTKWNNGKAEHVSTGAVTVLKDLDKDGAIDLFHDIVTDMPGARAPDYLHQNNDIAFDADGTLYITSGISSDGHPPRHKWEGTILKALPPTYEEVSVFATGLRNTFGLVVAPGGTVFATDNDAQSGQLGNLGDKLTVVRQGDDFGHPYAGPGQSGVASPLLLSKFALAGIAVSPSKSLPDTFRDSLYVVSYGEGRVLRYKFTGDKSSLDVKAIPFAVVPAATDIAAAPNGDFYIISYENRTLHRVRLKQ